MSKDLKHRIVNEKIVSEYFKYYKFLSYEKFTSLKTNKETKLPKNSKLVYTMIANLYARLVKTNHFITNENKKRFVRFDAEVIGNTLGLTRQTVMTKIKQLIDLSLLEREGTNLIHVPSPKVKDARSTFVDKQGVTRLTYAQIPKYLVEHKFFKELNENCIIYYALVKERHLQSFQNNKINQTYVDKHGKTCCWFTNEEACELLGINEETLKKDRNILYAKGLLKSKRFGKALAYYAYEPINLPKENEETDEVDEQKSESKNTEINSIIEKLGFLNLKVRVEKFEKLGLSNTGFSNTSISKTEPNDMYDMYSSNIEKETQTNQTNHNSSVLDLNVLQKDNLTAYLPERLASYFKNFSVKEIEIIKNDLFKGKAAYFNNLKIINQYGLFVQYSNDVEFSVETLEDELNRVLSRLNNKRNKSNESIEQLSNTGYILTSFKNVFINAYNDLKNDKKAFENDLKQSMTVFAQNFKKLNMKQSAKTNKSTISIAELNAELDELGVY